MACSGCQKKRNKIIEQGKKNYEKIPDKLKSMYAGWRNVLERHPEVELVAHAREKICSRCEYKRLGICTKCGCPIVAKVRSLQEACPDDPPRWLPYKIVV